MSNRIRYDATTAHGRLLAELADGIIKTRELAIRINSAAKSMNAGNDDATLEAEFGLASGKADDVMFLLQTVEDAMSTATMKDIASSIDQG